MLYKDICYLGEMQETTNDYGDVVVEIVYSLQHVFTNTKSVGQKEFYEAQATGFKPELKLEMSVHDYNNQRFVKCNNVEYSVVRTYQKGLDIIEVTLERGVNNASS